ncbi:hypothetical protein RHS01_08260 [Rhizoctonia solani]|uniref:MYND-type domain-containing protein n=1 Tax=Rhizoctonia solani TaxID=456999 RepID=A0A8H7IAY4_9AGAM|nr:hypothetical protein RHS01_08260 [Rhizoctonia solani]
MIAATASLRLGELSDSISSLDPAKIVEQMNVTTLESILKMANDVDTYQYFKSQRLIGGCIALMQKIKVEEKSSRIMRQNMRQTPGIECPLVFSSQVAQVVRQEIRTASQGLECDSILGWGTSDDDPLASDEHVKALVQMLWDDRANLLRVLSSAYSPAISGLLFLLWRCTYLDAADSETAPNEDPQMFPHKTNHGDPLWMCKVENSYGNCSVFLYVFYTGILLSHIPACGFIQSHSDSWLSTCAKALFRYILSLTSAATADLFGGLGAVSRGHVFLTGCALVATSDQGEPMLSIADGICKLLGITPGEGERLFPRSPDPGDSRMIFEAYVSRLVPSDTRVYAPVSIMLAIILLELVVANMRPGLEGLLSTVFQVTVERVLSPSVQKDILEAFVKSDLADLAGSVLFALNANAIENTPDSDTNYNLMKTIQTTFHTIGTTHTPAILEECSRDYAPDWIKVQHQFVVRGMCMDLYTDRDRNITTTPSAVRKRHYELCNGVWDSVAQALRLKDQIARVRRAWNGCVFLRCQDPIGIDRRGVAYACSECKAVPYCSVRCQAG